MYINDNKVEYNFSTLNVNPGAGYLVKIFTFEMYDIWAAL